MLGAIVGDIVGSRFEWNNIKSKEFELFSDRCRPTDDSVMTLAIAQALLNCEGDIERLGSEAIACMQALGRKYPGAGYGGRFRRWIFSDNPLPYHSFGNGSAMRVSPCAWAAKSLEQAIAMAKAVTEVTHNHPEGLKGAEATVSAVYLALHGGSIPEIREYISENYYALDFTLNEIRPDYSFDVSCQGSVPQAITAFLESESFEDAIRNAISIGGDSDTIAAIAGGIAGAFYGVPETLRQQALRFLDDGQKNIVSCFEHRFTRK